MYETVLQSDRGGLCAEDGCDELPETPGGTRGTRTPRPNPVTRALMRVMTSWHRRAGDKFQGMDLLYLTTVGAKSGEKRQSTVARFTDGEGRLAGGRLR